MRLLEATSTVTSTGTFTAQARKSFRFLALELNSHANTEGGSGYPRLNARMGIRNRRTYIYIFTRKMVPITGRASASFSSMLKLKRIGNE